MCLPVSGEGGVTQTCAPSVFFRTQYGKPPLVRKYGEISRNTEKPTTYTTILFTVEGRLTRAVGAQHSRCECSVHVPGATRA